MPKVQLTPKQVLEYIVLGIKNGNYQASIDLAEECIKEMEAKEQEKNNQSFKEDSKAAS